MNMNCITNEQLIELLKKKQGKGSQLDLARKIGITPMQMSDVFTGRRAIRHQAIMDYVKREMVLHFTSANGQCIDKHGVIRLLKKEQGDLLQVAFADKIGVTPVVLSQIYKGRRDPTDESVLRFLGLKKDIHFVRTK
jgi:DNA-binding transcriptional regulator YdaS (Cro superfamily)